MKSSLFVRWQQCLLWSGLFLVAGQTLIAGSAIDFFTNVGDRLLQSQSGVSLTRIQVYPTNQYSPEVHRRLRLTANLYDSTTNRTDTAYPYLPSVFRPVFAIDEGSIFIVGYVEETGTAFLNSPIRDLNDPADRAALQPDDFVYGVPLIIGAKKGVPNFNEFSMQSVVQVTRKLELRRQSTSSRANETNQMYVVGISNVFAVEAWNSYSNTFPRDLELRVTNEVSITMTNESGLLQASHMTMGQIMPVAIPANTWQGFLNPQNSQQSFRIPLLTNVIFLTNSVYRQLSTGGFVPVPAQFERGVGFPIPQWGLSVSNRLRFILVDAATQRVLDYVNLDGLNAILEITREVFGNSLDDTRYSGGVQSRQWLTNRPNNSSSVFAPTYGIMNQVEVSLGNLAVNLADWDAFSLQNLTVADKNKAIDSFRAFMGLTSIYNPGTINTNLVQPAPFSPTRKLYHYTSWQANDPLVHYTLSDLTDLALTNDTKFITPPNQPAPPMPSLSKINTRYQPWGGNPIKTTTSDLNAFNLALKDPLVSRSDDWEFPESQPLNINSIGRVHRGTPWQTIYLKSPLVEANVWEKWTGIADEQAAELTQPNSDWRLVTWFVPLLNTRNPHSLFSVNQLNVKTWSRALNGIQVLTNTLTDAELYRPHPSPEFDVLVMRPGSPQAAVIADAIADTRLRQPNQYFRELGDILATPELSVASPWLNRSSSIQLTRGITDEAYEKIPEQLLPVLRSDSVGSIAGRKNQVVIQFSGVDGQLYAVDASSDLLNWTSVSTNSPTNGVFFFRVTPKPEPERRFYRSVLLP